VVLGFFGIRKNKVHHPHTGMPTWTKCMMTDEDAEYERMDAWEDEALARLRDADAWSEEETDEEDSLECLDGHFMM
jgi:hypothetical protein